MTSVPPIRREIVVGAPPEVAFALFTSHIGAWWPLAAYSVFCGSVALEGDRLVERSGAREAVWAEVTDWQPPRQFALNWHPREGGGGPSTAIRVNFDGVEQSTRVTLEHSGWEALADPAAARQEYDSGWPGVLARFAGAVSVERPTAEWFVLTHTPGPALPDGSRIFTHPDFAEHVAFLDRLAERQLLVAAGPLTERSGTGMAVLRIPAGEQVDVAALATGDDQSVVRGILQVRVEPWDVRVGG
jgi:uncharacterized protein YciI